MYRERGRQYKRNTVAARKGIGIEVSSAFSCIVLEVWKRVGMESYIETVNKVRTVVLCNQRFALFNTPKIYIHKITIYKIILLNSLDNLGIVL